MKTISKLWDETKADIHPDDNQTKHFVDVMGMHCFYMGFAAGVQMTAGSSPEEMETLYTEYAAWAKSIGGVL